MKVQEDVAAGDTGSPMRRRDGSPVRAVAGVPGLLAGRALLLAVGAVIATNLGRAAVSAAAAGVIDAGPPHARARSA
ncbi:MAG TPA: hypothetical protein VGF60_02275 [Xanthobacteraceae bacterium]